MFLVELTIEDEDDRILLVSITHSWESLGKFVNIVYRYTHIYMYG